MGKIIISDTSCLIALSNIGLLNILKDLYGEVIITTEVKKLNLQKTPVSEVKLLGIKTRHNATHLDAILARNEFDKTSHSSGTDTRHRKERNMALSHSRDKSFFQEIIKLYDEGKGFKKFNAGNPYSNGSSWTTMITLEKENGEMKTKYKRLSSKDDITTLEKIFEEIGFEKKGNNKQTGKGRG